MRFWDFFYRNFMPRLLLLFIFVGFSWMSFAEVEEISDPLEPVNRKIFWFNDQFDVYVGEPAARAYVQVTPDFMQNGIGNFFMNLSNPTYALSSLMQGKLGQSAEILGRFLINSIVGVLGFIDVAEHLDLPHHREDFGLMFAEWGFPAGPYIVLPLLGSSNVRDAFGLALDAVSNPLYWTETLFGVSSDESLTISLSASTLMYLDLRADLFNAVETAKESSLDYYLFMQSAYYQHRRGLLYDGSLPEDDDAGWADDDWFSDALIIPEAKVRLIKIG